MPGAPLKMASWRRLRALRRCSIFPVTLKRMIGRCGICPTTPPLWMDGWVKSDGNKRCILPQNKKFSTLSYKKKKKEKGEKKGKRTCETLLWYIVCQNAVSSVYRLKEQRTFKYFTHHLHVVGSRCKFFIPTNIFEMQKIS